MKKGLIVALIHLLLVCSLGAKLLYDRATRPRVWIQSFSYDPSLPIRGRYVSLAAKVESADPVTASTGWFPARLEVRNGKLFAIHDVDGSVFVRGWEAPGRPSAAVLAEPCLMFIPEHISDSTRLAPGEQLWFEATIPKKGPPRPIRLAIKKPDGKFVPVEGL